MPEIVIGLIGAYVGWSLYNTALVVAKNQIEQVGNLDTNERK